MDLKPVKYDIQDGKVVLVMQSEDGQEFRLPLSIFDISMVVSGLYTTRDSVLEHKGVIEPDAPLPLTQLSFFTSECETMQILRIHVGEGFHQDFVLPADSDLGRGMKLFEKAVANVSAISRAHTGSQH